MDEQDINELKPKVEQRVLSPQDSLQAASELQAFKALKSRSERRRRNLLLRIMVASLIITGVLFVGWLILRGLMPDTPTVMQPTDFVYRGDFSNSIQGNGNLLPLEQVTINPEIDGVVVELYVSEGDSVEAGQLLFTLDNPDLDTAIAMAERGVESARLGLRSAQANRDEAGNYVDQTYAAYAELKALYEYSLTLAPDDPMLELTPTKADVDAAYSVYRQSVLSLDGSKLGLESAQLAVDDAQASLDAAIALAQKRQVYAPISGLVVVMNLERGSRLSSLTSFGQVPIQIADVSQMRLTISVNELDILGVKPGMQAIINVDALMDYTAEAEVLRVASTSSNSDYYYGGGLVYYSVDLLLKDPDPRLKIGMTANAQIITLSYENVLLVNTMALQSTVDSTYLQVLDADGSVRNVPVELIASDYSVAVVSGAIKEGDEVLLGSGSYNTMPMIRSGVDVDVEPVR